MHELNAAAINCPSDINVSLSHLRLHPQSKMLF